MRIQTAHYRDLSRIRELYDEAIRFQRAGGHPYWKDLDLGVVEADIAAGTQYTLTLEQRAGDRIAGIFSFCPPSPMDESLWRGMEPASARYVHRIIVGRPWRGQRLFGTMLAWCEEEVRRLGCGRLRLDTWAENAALIDYYAGFGFRHMGERTAPASEALAPQYRGVRLAIMEKAVSFP